MRKKTHHFGIRSSRNSKYRDLLIFLKKIIVLEKGKVVEEGTHIELLATNGRYAFFWNIQSRKEREMNEIGSNA
jgi:hypothetical protein